MILGTPKAAKPCSWQARKCSVVWETVNPTNIWKATGIAHRDGSVGTPVDLRTLAGSEVQLQIDRPLGRPDAADVIPQDRHAAAVSLLAQTLSCKTSLLVPSESSLAIVPLKGSAAGRSESNQNLSSHSSGVTGREAYSHLPFKRRRQT